MNVELINWVWEQSKVEAHELPTMLALAKHADLNGEATVTLAELVRLTRCSDIGVKDSIRHAVRLKELEIIQNVDANGQRATNTYRFTVYKPVPGPNGADLTFDEPPSLPGIPAPKVRDLPREPQPKLLMDAAALAAIAADPTYQGLDVNRQAWRFRRWCEAQVPKRDQTVRAFKVWLSKV